MGSRLLRIGTVVAVLALLGTAVAGLLTGGPPDGDRAYELEQRLRCPVCKSVSIAESPSDTAKAMRVVVAEQIEAGRTDQQIIDYFRARYGDWVLLDPPAAGTTLPLWLLPFAALSVGGVVLFMFARRRTAEVDTDLTSAQRERVTRAVERTRVTADEEDAP